MQNNSERTTNRPPDGWPTVRKKKITSQRLVIFNQLIIGLSRPLEPLHLRLFLIIQKGVINQVRISYWYKFRVQSS